MRRSIFILGANSVVARAIIPTLAEDNTIITAGRTGCDVYCDIAKGVDIPGNVDAVINFAAALGGDTYDEITGAIHTNVLGVLNMCEAASRAATGHVINISSIYALAHNGDPNYSIYSITKNQGDEIALYFCKLNGLPLTVVRPSRIYGDSADFGKNQPFLYAIIDRAQKGEDISIFGSNDAKRNYIHCLDLAEVIRRVIDQSIEGVYSCTYPENVRVTEIAAEAQRIFGRGGTVSFLADKPDIPDDTYPVESTIYEEIAFSPRISLRDGISRVKDQREAESK